MDGDPVPAVAAGTLSADGSAPATSSGLRALGWVRTLSLVAIVAGVVTAVGALLDPVHTGTALLTAAMYVLGMALGGLAFVAFAYLTKAGWSVAIRRVPEVFAATLPLGAVLILLALVFLPWIYEWSHADVVEGDPILQSKAGWLSPAFFWVRAVAYLVLWLLFARALNRSSTNQDLDGDVRRTNRNVALSALFLVVFAVTFSLATFDWLMSLEPHWFSTVYAVYNFSGMFVAALSAMIIAAILLRQLGPFEGILRPDHLHDMAKLLFGFATFWAYIWFCQYMLIWYANIPEETAYFSLRQRGAWGVLMHANVVVNWLIPFLVLLPRPAKRSESVLLKVCVLLLIGRWLDLYLMIAPSHQREGPVPTLWDASAMVFGVALLVLVLLRVLGRVRLVPKRDPMLAESLHHHI